MHGIARKGVKDERKRKMSIVNAVSFPTFCLLSNHACCFSNIVNFSCIARLPR